ncbi:hypothetical protein WDW37_05490 [Bdellovibrionota bacterium FG-1]
MDKTISKKLKLLLGLILLAAPLSYFVPSFRTPNPIHETDPVLAPPSPATKPLTGSHAFCSQLYRNICGKRGETRDPTGAVHPDADGELQALRTYEEIIHLHPDWASDQVDEELVRTIFTPKRRARIENTYQWVRGTIERFIDRQPYNVFTNSQKMKLKTRLRKTELQLPPPVSVYSDEPDLFTKNDVYYERTRDGKLRMRVGGAYVLNAKSRFNIIFTLAHEFAHSIDPCELRSAQIKIPAYDRISTCFIRTGLITTPPNRRECAENDQLSETFADWMAVQVVGEALKSFATEFHGGQILNAATNAVRDLCEQDEDDEFDLQHHPSPEIRIERIFGQNPEVRDVLQCGPTSLSVRAPAREFPYCDFNFNPGRHL